jgi:hypothetical protein
MIITPEHLEAGGNLRCLFFGPPGSGKTFLVGSALDVPEMLPLVFIDCEAGVRSIGPKLKQAIRAKQATLVTLDAQGMSIIQGIVDGKIPECRTLVIDSLTELYAFMMNQRLDVLKKGDQPPSQPDYRDVGNIFLKLMRESLDAPVHLLCTAGQNLRETEGSGTLHVLPDIMGKLDEKTSRFFDVSGYLTCELTVKRDGSTSGMHRTIQLQPYGRVHAKNRIYGMESIGSMDDPSMKKFYEAAIAAMSDSVDAATNKSSAN